MADVLRARDLRTVLDVAHTIGAAEDLASFRQTVLETAPRLVQGDVHGYNEVPPRRVRPLILMDSYPTTDAWWDAVVRLSEEHPLVLHYIATRDTDARAISDLMSRRRFLGSAFYRDVLSHAAGRDQLAVSMIGGDGLVIGLAVNRLSGGFSARDHAMYDAIRPFLVQGYQATIERGYRRMVASALGAAADAVEQPVVLVGRQHRVEHLTPGAAELIGTTEPHVGGRLPEPLASWLLEQESRVIPRPLTNGRYQARLVRGVSDGIDAIVLAPPAGALTLAALRALGLTGREAEVLALVAEGKSNAQAGRALGVAPATVAKHLQHVNEKLGATSRTDAVARARTLVAARN